MRNTIRLLIPIMLLCANVYSQKPSEYVPKEYVIFDEAYGDLNNDGREDCVLIVKGTINDSIYIDNRRGRVDMNRRGIIVLLNENSGYKQIVENYGCFHSEDEDGGIYFAPQLQMEIDKGILNVHYGHGRYGYWRYRFRLNNLDMELIGYDGSSNFGPVVKTQKSINFLTKKKLVRVNTNENDEGGEEKFDEIWTSIKLDKLIRLSEIKNFDELEMNFEE